MRPSETHPSETQRPNPFWFGLRPILNSAGSLSSVVNLDYLNRVGFSTHSRASVVRPLRKRNVRGQPGPVKNAEKFYLLIGAPFAPCALRPTHFRPDFGNHIFFAGQSTTLEIAGRFGPRKPGFTKTSCPERAFPDGPPAPAPLHCSVDPHSPDRMKHL